MSQVTRQTLKTDAERVVKRIEGVEAVDNQIDVPPLSRTTTADTWLSTR
jgi:osmotically-inducible protein OsmY